jgi:hypothetical protein
METAALGQSDVAHPVREEANAVGTEVHPLALKEEMIRDRFERFEDRVFRLRERLAQVEPESVARLARVLERAGELELSERLDGIMVLLGDSSTLTEALDAQAEWLEDADSLLRVLLNRGAEPDGLADKVESLQTHMEGLNRILAQQRALRTDTLEAARTVEKPNDLHELESEQRKVAGQTRALSESPAQGAAGDAQDGPDDEPPRTIPPGMESLGRAGDHMDDATESLERLDPAAAVADQDRAVEELEQARREFEETLKEARREQQDRTLRDLESRFREMLAEQRSINEATIVLGRLGRPAFRRGDRLKAAELSVRQRDLSERATACHRIVEEEGTTVVLPHVVGRMVADMDTVADELAECYVGELTQQIQRGIVDTLEHLLGAAKGTRRDNQARPEQTPRPNEGDAPLLPASAELRMLRFDQLLVNERTRLCRKMESAEDRSKEALARVLAETATRQAECADIAREMHDRQSQR